MDVEELKEQIEQGLDELEIAVSIEDDDRAKELIDDVKEHKENEEWLKCVTKLEQLKKYAENGE